jgi:hypothetical protein
MDFVSILLDETNFVHSYYDKLARPLESEIAKIENGEPPFDVAPPGYGSFDREPRL